MSVEDAARRVVKLEQWRWMERMITTDGYICGGLMFGDNKPLFFSGHLGCPYDFYVKTEWPSNPIPDLTDPATIGCLMDLVRDAWGNSLLMADFSCGRWAVVNERGTRPRRDDGKCGGWCETEAEALVASLEAAE